MRKIVAFIVLLSISLTAAAQQKMPRPAQKNAGAALHALFDAEWERGLVRQPLGASFLGDLRYNDRWSDDSLAAQEAEHKHNQQVLARLRQIPRAQLSAEDQLNYDLFEYRYRNAIEGFPHMWHLVRLNTFSGIHTIERIVNSLPFREAKHYDDWLKRLERFPAYMDQNIALMREGIRQKVMLPKITSRRVLEQLNLIDWNDPKKHGFYKPFTRFPANMPQAERDRLAAAGETRVREHVLPAFRRLRDFIQNEYLPASFEQVGAWQVPNGQEVYAYQARQFTTTRMTPDEIHDIGLREVERIRGEMQKVMEQVGFKGTREEFYQHLRTDPKFFYKTEDEVLQGTRALAKKIDPLLIKVLGKLPRLPYGVEPVPAAIAPTQPAAYASGPAADGSRTGFYYVNTYKPETRPKWEMVALALHEAAPGHVLQGSLAYELGELPKFRRYGGFTAYGEGWGLYSESLGYDMGLYDDPYDRFGQLSAEIWRAVRLVVDTGMHSKKWSREQALKYFMDNVATTELNATNEIDRYISWPGQALGYKIGHLKIMELRKRAEQKLGSKFDLRYFNDAVLGAGPLPLEVLEKRIDGWIAELLREAKAEQVRKRRP